MNSKDKQFATRQSEVFLREIDRIGADLGLTNGKGQANRSEVIRFLAHYYKTTQEKGHTRVFRTFDWKYSPYPMLGIEKKD